MDILPWDPTSSNGTVQMQLAYPLLAQNELVHMNI